MTHLPENAIKDNEIRVAMPNACLFFGLHIQLVLTVVVMFALTEVLVHWWLFDLQSVSWHEVLIRLVAAFTLATLCWRISNRPLQFLQNFLTTGNFVDTNKAPADWQPVLQAVHRALTENREAVNQQHIFIADASHQLRTPFAVLRVQLQGMQSGDLSVIDTLPKMLATVDRSSLLVRQILSMAKVNQITAQANWHMVNLDDVAREVCLACGPLIARKGLDFSLEATAIKLYTDAWMLGELLRNLISNAIHHAPRGSAIGLVVRLLPGQAEIIVWDNGGGIDEAVQDRLFEPFQSASGPNGVGLGLSICRQIAQSMNAQVNLYNRVHNDNVVGVDAVVRWPLCAGVQK